MHQRLNLRLKALEKRLPDETKPHKALLPEWLMEDLRQQGIRFDASGLPEKSSLQEKASERLETLERSQSERGGTSKDQIVRRVLEGLSDAELDLLGSAASAVAQGRELTPAESAAAEAYASAVARESAAVRSPGGNQRR